ncbi:hypothetical protein [Paraburkholderia sp. 32]|uniref:hypothetical protein n=1 Tax=Paraburkholderia sp. 32 TaxID=2991057 RepID=UPI003D261951
MCGIAGWVDYERDLNEQKPIIEAMTRTMALRGPDAQGIWIDRHAALGHRRLSVIDLEGGAQPMQAAEEGKSIACLTYSGEVYNFVKLRDELRKHGDCVCRLRETVIGHEASFAHTRDRSFGRPLHAINCLSTGDNACRPHWPI